MTVIDLLRQPFSGSRPKTSASAFRLHSQSPPTAAPSLFVRLLMQRSNDAVTGGVSVIIPTLNAGRELKSLIIALQSQTTRPVEILVVDSASTDDTPKIAAELGTRLVTIRRSEFGHGRTRNYAAGLALGDLLVFLTQDVEIAGDDFLKNLTLAITEGRAAASFARQLPREGASVTEAFSRSYSYPDASRLVRYEDIDRLNLGIRGFFFSNAASCVSKSAFDSVGGFPSDVILSEDMFLCARLLRSGYAVAYAAEATVRHSHDYTFSQHFRRYFDLGVAISRGRSEFGTSATSGDGLAYVKRQLSYVSRNGSVRDLIDALSESAAKFLGIQSGYREKWLPLALKTKLSMHRGFWTSEHK